MKTITLRSSREGEQMKLFGMQSGIGLIKTSLRIRDGFELVKWLLKRRIRIKFINLLGLRNVTDKGLGQLTGNCSVLQDLNLQDCTQLTDSAFSAIPPAKCFIKPVVFESWKL